jgi:pilin isopeptide linkage protein
VIVEEGTGDDAGKLVSTVIYGSKDHPDTLSENDLTIQNTYDAAGNATFSGTKTLEGREFNNGETFKFTIEPKDGAPLRTEENGASKSSVEVTTTQLADDATDKNHTTIQYGPLYFTYDDVKNAEPDMNGVRTKTFEYTVSEVPDDSKKGITYQEPKTLSITVADNGSGKLTVALTSGTEAPNFTNTYSASGSTDLKVKKTFTNGKLSEHQFTFKVTQMNGEGADAEPVTGVDLLKLTQNPTTVETTKNNNTADNEVVTLVGNIAFTEADVGKTFYFIIEEDTTGWKTTLLMACSMTQPGESRSRSR